MDSKSLNITIREIKSAIAAIYEILQKKNKDESVAISFIKPLNILEFSLERLMKKQIEQDGSENNAHEIANELVDQLVQQIDTYHKDIKGDLLFFAVRKLSYYRVEHMYRYD